MSFFYTLKRTSTLYMLSYFAVIAGLVTALTACSNNNRDPVKFSEANLQQDYENIPQNIIVRTPNSNQNSVLCHTSDLAHSDTQVRIMNENITFDSATSNIDHTFNSNAVIPSDSSIVRYQNEESSPEMLNLPGNFIALNSQETASYPSNFSLNSHGWQSNFLTPQQSPTQGPHQTTPHQGKFVKGGKGKLGTPTQSSVQQTSKASKATSKTPTVEQQSVDQVSSPRNKHELAVGQTGTTVGQSTPAQQKTLPTQSKLVDLGADDSQGVMHLNTPTLNSSSPCNQSHISNLQSQHFLNTYRPAIASKQMTPYNWGYYEEPIQKQSDNYTYYIYSKPKCTTHEWCNIGQ